MSARYSASAAGRATELAAASRGMLSGQPKAQDARSTGHWHRGGEGTGQAGAGRQTCRLRAGTGRPRCRSARGGRNRGAAPRRRRRLRGGRHAEEAGLGCKRWRWSCSVHTEAAPGQRAANTCAAKVTTRRRQGGARWARRLRPARLAHAPEASRLRPPASSTQVSGCALSTASGGRGRRPVTGAPCAGAAAATCRGPGMPGPAARLAAAGSGRTRMEGWLGGDWSAGSRAADRMRSRPALHTQQHRGAVSEDGGRGSTMPSPSCKGGASLATGSRLKPCVAAQRRCACKHGAVAPASVAQRPAPRLTCLCWPAAGSWA